MTTKKLAHPGTRNRILGLLPAEDAQRICQQMEAVSLAAEHVLLRPGERTPFVYFPLSGAITKLVRTDDRGSAGVGIVGNEGIVPLCSFLGLSTTSFQSTVQNPVDALRLPADRFEVEVERSFDLRRQLLNYTARFLRQVLHTSACNRLHTIEQRYSRWLLMTHDRLGVDDFVLKQEVVGRALGVRRMSITAAARTLQHAGVIRYVRGQFTILNRSGLEARACGCYRSTQAIDASLDSQ